MATNGSCRPLTPRQAQILLTIQQSWDRYGYPPTVRDLSRAFGISVNAIFQHLQALERKGWLDLNQGKWWRWRLSRSMRLLRRLYEVAEVQGGELVATGQWLAVEVDHGSSCGG